MFFLLLGAKPFIQANAHVPEEIPRAEAIIDTEDEQYDNLNKGKNALRALAALSGYPGMGNVIDGSFGAFFGTEAGRIQQALAVISQKLDQIKSQIATMSDYIAQKVELARLTVTIQSRINEYTVVVPDLTTTNRTYIAALNKLEPKPDESPQEREARLNLIKSFYINVMNANNNKFHHDVITLGSRVIDSDVYTGLDLYTALEKLVLYSHNWEHQGYAARVALQSHVTGLYTSLATMSMSGLIVGIGNYEEEMGLLVYGSSAWNKLAAEKLLAEVQLGLLQDQIVTINHYADTHPIIIRPANERYYQVPGHELLLKSTAVPKTVSPTWPNPPSGWVMNYDLFGRVLCEAVPGGFYGKYNTNGYMPVYGDGISAPYPSPEWLMAVHKDYGGNRSLYDIFASESEGNFSIGSLMSPHCQFVTNQWQAIDLPSYAMTMYTMKVVNPDGTLVNKWIANVITSGEALDGIRDYSPDMHIGLIVIPAQTVGLPEEQESIPVYGMEAEYSAPYKQDIVLSVSDRGDLSTYEWLVGKDDRGFELISGATNNSFALGPVDATMNGYIYRCRITYHALDGNVETFMSNPVVLNLQIIEEKAMNIPLIVTLSVVPVLVLGGVVTLILLLKRRRTKLAKIAS